MVQIIKVGGLGGSVERFGGDTASKQLIIRSGSVIDSISIGLNRIGGSGGSETVNTILPPDGMITLYTVLIL